MTQTATNANDISGLEPISIADFSFAALGEQYNISGLLEDVDSTDSIVEKDGLYFVSNNMDFDGVDINENLVKLISSVFSPEVK